MKNLVRISHRKAPSLAPQMSLVYPAVDTITRCWRARTGGSDRDDMSGRSFKYLAREAEAANVD